MVKSGRLLKLGIGKTITYTDIRMTDSRILKSIRSIAKLAHHIQLFAHFLIKDFERRSKWTVNLDVLCIIDFENMGSSLKKRMALNKLDD